MPFHHLDLEECALSIAGALKPFAKQQEDGALQAFARTAIELDLDFMRRSGAFDGQPYDEDAAFAHLKAGLGKKTPGLAWLAEDFSELWEQYLNRAGLIDWE